MSRDAGTCSAGSCGRVFAAMMLYDFLISHDSLTHDLWLLHFWWALLRLTFAEPTSFVPPTVRAAI